MTPSEQALNLSIELGDATTVDEQSAWGAFQTLKQARTNPELAASSQLAQTRAALRSYVTERRAGGHALFPNVTAVENKKRNEMITGLYTQPLDKVLPAENAAEIQRRASVTADPTAYQQKFINHAFLSSVVGRKLTPEEYPHVRQLYAKQALGLTTDTSDTAFFTAKQNLFKEEQNADKALGDFAQKSFLATLEGKARPEPDLTAIPERLRPSFKEAAYRSQREAHTRIRRVKKNLAPSLSEIETLATQALEGTNQPGKRGVELTEDWFYNVAASLPEQPADRQIALALIAQKLQTLPETEKKAVFRIFDSIERGGKNAVQSAEGFLQEGIGQGLQKIIETVNPGSPRAKELQERSDIRTDARALRRMFQGEIDPLVYATDGLVTESLVLAGGSAWTLPASFAGPAGWSFMAASFAGDSYQGAREENPEAGTGAQYTAALASGATQATVETVLNKVGFKLIGSKLPTLAGLMNKAAISNSIARATIAGGVKAAGITATEYTEEAIQGATDRFAQDLALEFSGIAPETDWGKFWGDWATVAGEEQRDTLLAIAPFAVVGAGAGSIGHFKYGQAIAKSKPILHALGFNEQQISDIVRQTDVKKTDALIKEAFAQGLENRTTEERSAALEVLREQNRLNTEAGRPRITRADSAFTFTFTDPITQESTEFETEEEALIHWRNRNLQVNQAAIENIQDSANLGSVDFLTSEGKASEDTTVETVDTAMTLPRAVKEGIATQEQLDARLQQFLLQEGLPLGEAVKAVESLVIKARSFTKQTRDGQLHYIIQLFKGVDPINIFEDFAEDALKRAIQQGFADPRVILSDLRAYEAATGDSILDPKYAYDPDNTLPLIEAFSSLARAQVIDGINAEALPPTVNQWLETITTFADNTLDKAKGIATGYGADINRAGTLRQAIAKGQLPDRLTSLIQDAIGINETETLRRMEAKYREQLAAEAMQGFPEIQSSAKGRIPHPETLRQNNHPLAGEVRRIWENMKRPTRARNKAGRTVDRTNEANAYFLPIGQMEDLDNVRRYLEQMGFDVETPADMIDALDSSISYNKPVYGTNSTNNESFSLGIDKSKINSYFSTSHEGQKLSEATDKTLDLFAWGSASASDGGRSSDLQRQATQGAQAATSEIEGKTLAEFIKATIEGRPIAAVGKAIDKMLSSKKGKSISIILNEMIEREIPAWNPIGELADSPASIFALNAAFRNPWFESVRIMAVDRDLKVIAAEVHSIGDTSSASVDSVQMMAFLLRAKAIDPAASLIFSHNHPGGDPSPSRADYSLTTRLNALADSLGVSVIDHVITNGTKGYSFQSQDFFDVSPEMDIDWTAVERTSTPSIDNETYTTALGTALRAANSETTWVLYLDARLRIRAMNILPVSNLKAVDMTEPFRTIIRDAADSGATAILTYFPTNTKLHHDTFKDLRAFANQANLRYIDSIFGNGTDSFSAYANGLMEESSSFSIGRAMPEPEDLSPVENKQEAERLFADGKTFYAMSELDDQLSPVTSLEMLRAYAPDQLGWTERMEDETSSFSLGKNPYSNAPSSLMGFTKDPSRNKSYEKQIGYRHEITVRLIDPQGEIPPSLDGIRGLNQSHAMERARRNWPSFEVEFVSNERFSPSFSLGPASISRIEAAIARKLTAAPDERAEFYSRLRDRLAGLTQRLEDMENGIGPFARKATDEAGEERRRIQDAIAEAKAIISALPIEARGRVDFDFEDITGNSTEKGRVNALLRLIDKADAALEVVLKKEYLEAFARTLDLASPDLRQNRSIRGRLTPETQRLINSIIPITHLTPIEAQAATIKAQASYDAIEAQYPDPTDETAVETWEAALASAQEELDLLNTFASLTSQTAAEIAEARKQLLEIYTKGRTARQILDQAKRSEIASQKREVIESLGGPVSQPKWAKRTEKAGFTDLAESFRLGLSSFHEVMEWLFPKSIAARDYQESIRASERAFTRAKIDARERFESFGYDAFNLTGKSRKRKLNRIIAALSKRRNDWDIEIAEGTRFETEKMTEEQAASILDGTLKIGWETDLVAMESLRQALADFRMQRESAKNQSKAFSKKVVKFQRLTQRGAPTFLYMSDMEAVYWLQLAAQDQYLPALDRYGFTAKVLEQIKAKIDPKALTFAGYLRKEYDAQWGRLNPVHQRLFGLDMPRIKNYAPGMFESLDSKGDATIGMDGAAGSVNAMSAGFTKARVHHMARPRQMNALAAYWSSLESTEYFIAWAETMRDMRQVFRSPDVRRVIEGNYGTRAARDFSTWLDTLETDGRARALEAIGLSELSQNTLTTQSAVGLAFNLGTVFKQWSAGLGHFMHIPTTKAIKATFSALVDPSTLKSVWNNEAIQQRILSGITPEDKRLMDAANASPSLAMELLDLGRLPIALADAAFTTLTGAASYKYQYERATKAGVPDAEAHRVALQYLDYVVTRTAQPATTQDKSLAENSAKGFAKFLFLFKSDPRQKFAKAASALRLLQRGDIKKPEAARRIIFSWMIYGLMAQVATDIWRSISRDDDDEENWNPEDYIAAMVAGPLSGLPLLGAALEGIVRSLAGSKVYTNSANPLDKAVAQIFREGGISSATWKAATADDIDVNEILAAATRDAGNLALLLGPVNPSFAIVPAGLRAVRDIVGIGGNLADVFLPESAEEKAERIIREEKATYKETSTTKRENTDDLLKELMKLDPATREKRLSKLDKDTRRKLLPRIKRAQMTPAERGLAGMPLAPRKQAIDRILKELPAEDRQPYLDRLEKLGIATP